MNIFEIYWLADNSRTWWLSWWQSFIWDFLIPLLTFFVTAYFARKSYCLEKQLKELQTFHWIVSVSLKKAECDTHHDVLFMEFFNQSNVPWFIVDAYFSLNWHKMFMNGRETRVFHTIRINEKIEWQAIKSDQIHYDFFKRSIKCNRWWDTVKNIELILIDSNKKQYKYSFSKEKWPDLFG